MEVCKPELTIFHFEEATWNKLVLRYGMLHVLRIRNHHKNDSSMHLSTVFLVGYFFYICM